MSIDVVFNLTTEDLKDIIRAGLDGGISYWGGISKRSSKGCICTHWADVPFTDDPSALLMLYNIETGMRFDRELNPKSIKEGFVALVSDAKEDLGLENILFRLIRGRYDREDADVLIQYALFSEVMYG